jgi:hypothetical protein
MQILELLGGDDKINEERNLNERIDELSRRLERTER